MTNILLPDFYKWFRKDGHDYRKEFKAKYLSSTDKEQTICEAIIEYTAFVVEYIENPSEKVMLIGVRKNPCIYKFLKHPTKMVTQEYLNRKN